MAHDLGLNMDPSAWNLSHSDSNRRIRIWWALYIQDKWSALGLGRPSYLNEEHCNVPMITIDAFSHTSLNNEPVSITPALQFIAMAHLTTILSDLLSTFYTLKAMDRVKLLPIEVLYSIMDEFQTRLHTFHEEHLCQLYNVNTLLDSSGSVILAFYTVEIVLYRAMLRCIPLNHPGYVGVRAQAKTSLLNVVAFLEKLHVSRLRAFWWSRKSLLPITSPISIAHSSSILMTAYPPQSSSATANFKNTDKESSNDTHQLRARRNLHVLPTPHQHHVPRHRILVIDHLTLPVTSPATISQL
jgi:hypothetical protein